MRFLMTAAGVLTMAGSPALAQTAPVTQPAASGQSAPAAAATTPGVGAHVHDASGQPVGTVASVTPSAIVVDTGAHQVGLPPNALGPDGKGAFISSLSKAQLDAAFEQQAAQSSAQLGAKLVPGAAVTTAFGAATAGTVKAADEQYVTLTTAKGDIKLPRNVFALDPSGNLIVRMTADQFNATIAQVKPAS